MRRAGFGCKRAPGVQVVPALERGELGDVPGPHLVGCRRPDRRLDVGLSKLRGFRLLGLFRLGEHSVDSVERREAHTPAEQLREPLRRRLAQVLWRGHDVHERLPAAFTELTGTGRVLVARRGAGGAVGRYSASVRAPGAVHAAST